MDGNKFAAYLKKRRKPESTTNQYIGHADSWSGGIHGEVPAEGGGILTNQIN